MLPVMLRASQHKQETSVAQWYANMLAKGKVVFLNDKQEFKIVTIT